MHAGSAFYCSRLRCTFPPFGWYTSTSSLFFAISKAVIVSTCLSPICLSIFLKDGLHLDMCINSSLTYVERKQEYTRNVMSSLKVLKVWRRDRQAPRRERLKVCQKSNQRLLCTADLVPNGLPVLESIYRTWRPLILQGKAALRLWFQRRKELYWYGHLSSPLPIFQTCDQGLQIPHTAFAGGCHMTPTE
jgi:hypothetical protein